MYGACDKGAAGWCEFNKKAIFSPSASGLETISLQGDVLLTSIDFSSACVCVMCVYVLCVCVCMCVFAELPNNSHPSPHLSLFGPDVLTYAILVKEINGYPPSLPPLHTHYISILVGTFSDIIHYPALTIPTNSP